MSMLLNSYILGDVTFTTGQILTSGDMQSGTDTIIFSGDEQDTGTDSELWQEAV